MLKQNKTNTDIGKRFYEGRQGRQKLKPAASSGSVSKCSQTKLLL